MKKREQKKFYKEKSYSPLRPLVDANKIKVNGKPYNPKDKMHTNVYNKFKERANSPSITQPQRQLADFIIQNLAKTSDQLGNNSQKQYGALDYVDLREKPYIDSKTKERMDYYNGSLGKKKNEQGIILSPSSTIKYPLDTNPLNVLSHEGVHSLDDSYMRTHQNEVVDYLAKNAPKNDDLLKKLITDTQNILNEPAFSQGYTYDGFFKDKISKSLKNLKVRDLQKAQQSLQQDRKDDKDSGDNLMAFSEFPAFAIEKLYTPWTPSPNPQANEFLSNIMQGVQRNFQELGLDNQQYSDIIQAFEDRINELNGQSNSQQLPLINLLKKENQQQELQQKEEQDYKDIQQQPILLNAQQQNEYEGYKNDRSAFDDSPVLSPVSWLKWRQQKQKEDGDIDDDPYSSQHRKPFADGGSVSGDYDPYLNTYNYAPPLRLADYMDNQMPDPRYEDVGYGDPYMPYANSYDTAGQQSSFREGGSVKEEDLPRLADLIRRHGRNGDTELAHINPIEAHILKSLGGSGTINPDTGLREYSFWKKPWKAIRSVIGGGAGAVIGNMIAPGIGGIIGGALGQGVQHAARGKSALGGALKGAGMGAALPSVASGLGWGASKLGASGFGSSLSNYGSTNAILPTLGMGSSGGNNGFFGLGGNNPYVSGGLSSAAALSSGMGTGRGQGLGVSSGDYAENYYNYMLDRQKKQDNMGFTDKLKDYLTEPKNLLTLGTTAAQYLGREKPKSPEKIAEEERRYRNASRKTIAEVEADEALEAARADLQKKRKNKRLDEDIKNMGSARRRVVSPEEFARTGRWLEYMDEEGRPLRMKGGGSAHSPYAYLTEEIYYPTSPIGYLSGDSGGQDDLIDAKLSDGEYVFDASTVSDLGDGNNAAGARKLDSFRENIRRHKRGGKVNLPPRSKSLESYLRG